MYTVAWYKFFTKAKQVNECDCTIDLSVIESAMFIVTDDAVSQELDESARCIDWEGALEEPRRHVSENRYHSVVSRPRIHQLWWRITMPCTLSYTKILLEDNYIAKEVVVNKIGLWCLSTLHVFCMQNSFFFFIFKVCSWHWTWRYSHWLENFDDVLIIIIIYALIFTYTSSSAEEDPKM